MDPFARPSKPVAAPELVEEPPAEALASGYEAVEASLTESDSVSVATPQGPSPELTSAVVEPALE